MYHIYLFFPQKIINKKNKKLEKKNINFNRVVIPFIKEISNYFLKKEFFSFLFFINRKTNIKFNRFTEYNLFQIIIR